MLTSRQFQIFKFYMDNKDTYIPSKKLSLYFNISVRTIKNEIKTIKDFCLDYASFNLETLSNKGTKLTIHDEQLFKKELLRLQKTVIDMEDNTQKRVNSILKLLLDKTTYVTKYQLTQKFFISESTLYNCITELKKILIKYNLTLIHKTNLGYLIIGNEVDKRMCLAKNELNDDAPEHLLVSNNMGEIYNIVADTFIKYCYHVNEQTLQNITAHIATTVQRVKNHHYITKKFNEDFSSSTEFDISNEILSKFFSTHMINESYYFNEVNLLTQIILGKLDYSKNEELQKEVNDFINHAFALIYNKFYINLDSIENLKLLLALHLIPLFYRIKSGTQLLNLMSFEICQSFPQAYDLALYFSLLINEHFELQVSSDEVSYLTLYFNYGLENYPLGSTGKKILIITPLRKSETILLRHKILTWFPSQIEEINFIYPDIEDFESEAYDAIFSTEENLDKYRGSVNFISLFPNEKDYKKINLAINGYTDFDSIADKFCEECFFYGTVHSKDEILNIVTANAVRKYNLDTHFIDIIKDRENITSTYFGNGIAMPHPLTPVSDETFVSIGVLKKPIKWDSNHNIQFVMLISIAKNNPKEFQFWYYMSSLIRNEELFQVFYTDPTYHNFLKVLQLSLQNEFK